MVGTSRLGTIRLGRSSESHPGAPHRQYCRAEAQPVDAADGLPHDGAFRLADFSKGVVNLVSGQGNRAGAELASNPKAGDDFLHGVNRGRRISFMTEALKTVKRISLELGSRIALLLSA